MLIGYELFHQCQMFDMYVNTVAARGGRSAWWWYSFLHRWPALRNYYLIRQSIIGQNYNIILGHLGFLLVALRLIIQRFFYLRFRYWYLIGAPYHEAPIECNNYYSDCMRIAHRDLDLGPTLEQTVKPSSVLEDIMFTGFNLDVLTNPFVYCFALFVEIAAVAILSLAWPNQINSLSDLNMQKEPAFTFFSIVITPWDDAYIKYDFDNVATIPLVVASKLTTAWLNGNFDDDEFDD